MADTRGKATRIVRRVAVVAVTCTLVPVIVMWLLQDRLVYGGDDARYPVDPGAARVEDVGYTTADGVELHGWFVRHRSERSGCTDPPTVVVFHGSFTNMTWGHPLASSLADHGFDVFLAEYRGFGGMPGSPSEQGLRLDALAAIDAARGHAGDAPVVLMGLSLGTGVAVMAATEQSVAGLVLVAPYTSLPDVAWAALPLLPYDRLMRDQYATIDRIGAVDAPTLVVLGTRDETVPPEQSRAVYAASGHPDGLVELEGKGHLGALHEVAGAGGGAVISAVRRWSGCQA